MRQMMNLRDKNNSRSGKIDKRIIFAIIGLGLFFIFGFVFVFYFAKDKVKTLMADNLSNFQLGIRDLENFNFASATLEFSNSSDSLSSGLNKSLGSLSFLFNNGGPFGSLLDISSQVSNLSQKLNDIEGSAFTFLATGNGQNLIASLNSVQDNISKLNNDINSISNMLSVSGSDVFSEADLLSLRTQSINLQNFLKDFIPWFSSNDTHHILVLLQNPSEIRPTGGFLGSYADVAIKGGNIQSVILKDISDVDLGFKKKIIPPQPLQLEVSRWRPADANWFFDFRSSASQTASFFEQSDFYSASGTKFDFVIGISQKVISDILALTGPVSISPSSTISKSASASSSQITFESDTFLIQLQKIVQDQLAKKSNYPKDIIKDLSIGISEKIVNFSDQQKQSLMSMFVSWINNKDILLYSDDNNIENFFENIGASGSVANLAQNFEGDYLAIVDTNINGQKSDLYITQNVDFQSQINSDGTVNDNLLITRTHTGDQSPYWWYNAKNQDYLRIFVPLGTTLLNESGGVSQKINPPISYKNNGYIADPLLSSIESTRKDIFGYPVSTYQESGKEVFATWAKVSPGSSTTISFNYSHRLFVVPADGAVYQFIFDKQSSVPRHYKFQIAAPIGFQFKENGLPLYEYETDNLPGRFIVNLTLKKI
jgi:hypothetical protein